MRRQFSRGIMLRASTDLLGYYRGALILRVYGGVLFSGGNMLVFVLGQTLWRSTDLVEVVRT